MIELLKGADNGYNLDYEVTATQKAIRVMFEKGGVKLYARTKQIWRHGDLYAVWRYWSA